ncbi:hypothetical protein [Nesterenkonia xinjiangensis]|uniref:Heparinase II/III-like protein n=1 Tax=Nesterenkonia xinjiangensis TaxID=225327 RepID=A0A7Z0GLQ5_9MICC|nr:hypothetical protein [Nesterenkonia xinjiangensis]NYJ77799.1 hypothetical protein [Nesterenkonia xinjiangensis]
MSSAVALGAGALVRQGPPGSAVPFEPLPDIGLGDESVDRAVLQALAEHNDARILADAASVQEFLSGSPDARWCVREVKKLVAAFAGEDSAHHGEQSVLNSAEELLEHVQGLQTGVGLFDAGNNLESPPDSCFSLVDLVTVKKLVDAAEGDRLAPLGARLDELVPSVAAAVVEAHGGGVHTSNHRWEVAGALLAVNDQWPDPMLVERADEWLAEGIDVYGDGQYSERSSQYSSEVVNPSLLRIAEHTDDGALLDMVRANLKVTVDLTDPDGHVETIHSRRQDQWRVREDWLYLLQYREFALRDDDAVLARRAEEVLAQGPADLGDFYADVLARPALAQTLPEGADRQVAELLDLRESSGLIRVPDEAGALTCFAGSDHPQFRRTASGLSTNPTFLRYRRGAAELTSLRISPRFFSMGPLRPVDLVQTGRGWQMSASHRTGYHQPITRRPDLRSDGMYDLEDDGRFHSAMSFSARDLAEVRYEATFDLTPADGGWTLSVESASPQTLVVAQLVFSDEGELEFDGEHDELQEAPPEASAAFLLRSGGIRHRVGGDSLGVEFEGVESHPGEVDFDSGEEYSYMGGRMPTPEGVVVWVPFRAPGTFSLRLSS